ncbi:MAG: acetyl-CoA carboxylase biotin carboxyl carrier protein subunit [Bdellovibrionales bacterium]
MRRLQIEIDGRPHTVFAEKINGVLWYHWNGRTYSVNEEETRKARGGRSGAALAKGEIQAPMPGKVTKVLVQSGTKVKTGAALVVMEAMKMEYTLNADGDGAVKDVSCKPGDQVRLGQLLVRLELAEA